MRRLLLTLLFFLFAASAFAQKPPINGVAGPTSSAQLRTIMTDETGNGVLYFQNGDLGTPSAGLLSNATGLPISTGVSGLGTGVATALGVNIGSAGAPVLFNGAGGTPTSLTLTNATGLPISTGISGLGTGVATALGVNIGSAGAPVLFNGAGGTPTSITLTNGTGLPISTGVSGLGTGVATALGVNVGSAGAPVLFDGAGGTPTSLTLTNATGLPVAGGGTGAATFATNGVLYGNGTGAVQATAAVASGVLVTNGANVPSISTTLPNGLAMGTPTSITLTGGTGLPIATGVSGLGTGVATFLGTPSSANLRAAVTDETGTGALFFAGGNVGAASGTSLSLSGLTGLTGSLITTQTVSGTSGSPIAVNTFDITADTAIQNAGSFVTGWQLAHHFGGASVQGGREAFATYLYLDATTSGSNTNRNYAAVNGIATANASDGGTNPAASGTSAGAIFGSGFVGVAGTGATALLNVTGAEFNVAMQTGSSVWAKTLAQFSARTDDRVAGSGINAMLWFYNQSVSNPAWTDGILFDDGGGTGAFPFNNTSTVLRTGAGTINVGIDFSGTTVSSYAFKSPAFSVSGAGALVALNGSFNNGGFQIINGGISDLELGGTSQTPLFDWHSSASVNDYDFRMLASGGNASSGNGTMTFTGATFSVAAATTLQQALTYGGVTLSNSVTGTGSMVLSASPTLTGTVGAADVTASGIVTTSALKTSTALITATGGSTPSFGTNFIGGAGGPTTAAQNAWLKAQDSTGATVWIPVWK